jgi:hypothetical protein
VLVEATQSDELFSPPNEGQDSEREAPDDVSAPQRPQPRTYGDENKELPEELQNAGLALLQEAQRQELYQRRMEVMRARRKRFYERGLQHIYYDILSGVFVQGAPGQFVPDSGHGEIQCGEYIADYNIFARALQIIIAKLTENQPGIDFQPDSGNSPVDLQASDAAEAYRILYDRRNDTKDLLTAIVRMMGLDGRTLAWTRTMENEQKWGTDENGVPRRVQTSSIYGVLETKVPIVAKTFEEWPYCIITEDPHVYTARKEHPDFADKIGKFGEEGIADTQFERLARLGALQGNSAAFQLTDTYDHYTERKYFFFRPSMLTDEELDSAYTDEVHQAEPWTLRDALNEAFPDGGVFIFVGKQYVGSRNVCIDDELSVDFPYAGDGMARMAIMDPAVVIQDRFNDDMNLYAEWKDFGSPSTWLRAGRAQVAAINDQTAAPFCFRPAMELEVLRDRPLADSFYREPNPELPETFIRHTEYLATALLQYILAIPSAVQGAGMPDQKTKGGYQEAIYQAMGQLGVIWGAVQRLMSKVYRQAALAAARDDKEGKPLIIPGPKGAVTLDISALGKGHFLAHPDTDSGYPESTMQKRVTLSNILEMAMKDPVIGQALLSSPDTWDFIFRTYGVPEIVIPEARVRRKQSAEIEMLIQQSPQQGPPDPLTGIPGAMVSTVPVDPLDYHDWEFEECREKLSDWPWVQQQLTAGNQAGIENIRLHALEHQKFMQQAVEAQQQAQAAAIAATNPKATESWKPELPKEAPGPPAQENNA